MTIDQPIALITGANRGIGFTLAQTLSQHHGFRVLLGARNSKSGAKAVSKLRSHGLTVDLVELDLSSDSSIIKAAAYVKERYGHIDVLVNNAGFTLEAEWTGKAEDLRRIFSGTFDTNVFGAAAATEAFVPLLRESAHKPPRILFLSSTLGSISNRVNKNSMYDAQEFPVYRASKAALNMVAASYARKFLQEGWKVNIACPGYVKTESNNGAGLITEEEAMPNLVRLCMLGDEGETGTFSSPDGNVLW